MAKNKIQDLRNHLFETIEKLNSDENDNNMTVEKAKAIADCGQVILNTAKLELDFIKMVNSTDATIKSSGFIQLDN